MGGFDYTYFFRLRYRPMHNARQELAAISSQPMNSSLSIDFVAVCRAAQSIGRILHCDGLLCELPKVFLKYSGGDRCVILLWDDIDNSSLQVRAIATAEGTDFMAIALEAITDLPIQLISHVKATKQIQTIFFGEETSVVSDPYLEQHQPYTVLCLPLLLDDEKLQGIVYLENQHPPNICSNEQLTALHLLATQAAIAIENAHLYEQAKADNLPLEQPQNESEDNKQKEMSSEKMQERLAFLIEQNPIAIIEWNTKFKVIGWNPAATTIFGYSATEMLGNHAMRIVPTAFRSHVIRVFASLRKQQGGNYSLNQNVRKDGEIITCEWFNTPLRDAEDNVIGIFSMVQDISDRERNKTAILQKTEELEEVLQDLQQAQLQMVQSEKMSALGNLVAGVAHEINNPISFVEGNIQYAQTYVEDLLGLIDFLIKRCPADNEEIDAEIKEIELDFIREDLPKLIDSMNLGIDRIRNISNSLRTFSRRDRDHKVEFDICDGLDSTLLILKHRTKSNDERPHIHIEKTYGDIPKINCFPGQLNQVFMNILANAIDAFDEANRGKSFDDIKANPNCITIETTQQQNCVQITLRDNGCGMEPETHKRIFEQGFTTKAVGKGTGLGMAIAHQIITEKHGGTIMCDSQLGMGTTFTIQLPITEI